MNARVYTDTDVDATVLSARKVAVVGYGNQGHAQAQNLRDSGVNVVVGNRDDEYRPRAEADGFVVRSIPDAASDADVLLLLIPDEVQPDVAAREVVPGLTAGDTVVVASGYNLAFGLLPLPAYVDVVMVAPRMIGEAVRDRYQRSLSFPCLLSVEQDVTGDALSTALAVAHGIGATAGGAVASSAAEEAALDLFTEQAIWPSIIALLEASYEVLSQAGFSDEAILDEMYLSGEPAEVFARVSRLGLLEQLATHSRTSQYGQLTHLARSADLVAALRERFSRVLHDDILSGEFARDWAGHEPDSAQLVAVLRENAAAHPLITAERHVRGRTSHSPDDSARPSQEPIGHRAT